MVAVSKTASALTLVGSKFFQKSSGYSATVTYCGTSANSVFVTSSTLVSAGWSKGLPPCQQEVAPSLSFESASSYLRYNAQIKDKESEFDNPQIVTKTEIEYSCSFAGGCLYDVEMKGLASSLENS